MKIAYRGFEIDCHRDKSLGGDTLLYFTVYRLSDSFELICGFTDGDDSISDYVRYMRDRVDGFIADPGEEVLPDHMSSAAYTSILAGHRTENEKTEREHAR